MCMDLLLLIEICSFQTFKSKIEILRFRKLNLAFSVNINEFLQVNINF